MPHVSEIDGTAAAYNIDRMNEQAIHTAYMEAAAYKRRLEAQGVTSAVAQDLRNAVWQLRAAYVTSIAEALVCNDGEVGHLRDQLGDASIAIRDAQTDVNSVADTLKHIEKAANIAIKLLSAAVV